jgi:hypothetical protein
VRVVAPADPLTYFEAVAAAASAAAQAEEEDLTQADDGAGGGDGGGGGGGGGGGDAAASAAAAAAGGEAAVEEVGQAEPLPEARTVGGVQAEREPTPEVVALVVPLQAPALAAVRRAGWNGSFTQWTTLGFKSQVGEWVRKGREGEGGSDREGGTEGQ